MPVTPFHLGPAVLVKAVCPRWFSLGAFTLVQIAIDIESASNLFAGRYPIHGELHTVPGALAVGVLMIPVSRWTFPPLMRLLKAFLARVEGYPPALLPTGAVPTFAAIALGALVGALSHVALDAVIHADVRPFGAGNPLYVPGSFMLMHALCLVAGALGVAVWLARMWRSGRRVDIARTTAHGA